MLNFSRGCRVSILLLSLFLSTLAPALTEDESIARRHILVASRNGANYTELKDDVILWGQSGQTDAIVNEKLIAILGWRKSSLFPGTWQPLHALKRESSRVLITQAAPSDEQIRLL